MSVCVWCGKHDEDPEHHYRYWHLPFDSSLLRNDPAAAVQPDEAATEETL